MNEWMNGWERLKHSVGFQVTGGLGKDGCLTSFPVCCPEEKGGERNASCTLWPHIQTQLEASGCSARDLNSSSSEASKRKSARCCQVPQSRTLGWF